MPRYDQKTLTEDEHRYLRGLYRIWEQNLSSVAYCTSQAELLPKQPSAAALKEATALVNAQILAAESSPTFSQLDEQSAKTDDSALRMSQNSFVEHYAMQVYQAHIFFIWHVAKTSGQGPERVPTDTERTRFERQFYSIWRLIIIPEQKFDQVVTLLPLAELIRLGNLMKYFVSHCHQNHTVLANIFQTVKGDKTLSRLETARDDRAKSLLGLPSGHFLTQRGYTLIDTWSIYNEIQDQINYQFPEDPDHPPPMPERIY